MHLLLAYMLNQSVSKNSKEVSFCDFLKEKIFIL